MPSLELVRSIALYLIIGLVSGIGWTWSLSTSQRMERRLGRHVPFAGGVGALASGILLLLGGWRILLPIQRWLTALLLPIERVLFVVLILLASVIWLGFTIGLGVSLLRTPADPMARARPFGFRRRR